MHWIALRAMMLATALTPLLACGAELDADTLISRLARPAPASIAFTEVRFSSLLREPAIVSGQLGYSGPESLERRVTEPYHETTEIHGDSVRVERDGEAPRSFALKRAPALRSLLAGFAALLQGDATAIRRSFDVELSGNDASWILQLTPKAAATRRQLQRIEVTGHADAPRCFSLLSAGKGDTNSSASVMLLGETANAGLPNTPTLDGLLELCRAE